jgi:outer membrane protein assembly factor BamB
VLKELKNDHHTFSRQIRKLANGNYLIVATGDGKVCELDPDGKIIRSVSSKEMAAQGVRWVSVHAAVKLDNGNLMISGGHVASLAEVDKDNKVVWSFTSADAPAELGLKYTAGFQIMPDGVIVIAAFDSKTKLYAIDKATKKVLWRMENGNLIGNPTHVLVLDGSEKEIGKLMR